MKPSGKRSAPAWQLYVHGLANVQHVLGRLWPYLGEAKREQARAAVRSWVEAPRTRFGVARLTITEQAPGSTR